MSAHDTSNAAAVAEGLGELGLNDTSPPRTNLPLPRELRDQIYHYLLSGEYAKDGTAYHFHTNILAVNRTIHEEAEQYLYERNIFVVVSYKWSTTDPSLLDSVPAVTTDNHKVARMRYHSMRFHASLSASKIALQSLGPQIANAPLRSLLTLLGDLEELCCCFQLRWFVYQGRVVYIVSDPARELELCVPPDMNVLKQPSSLFELRDTPHRLMNPDLQHSLLLPFHGLVADDQKVSVRGAIADAAGVEASKNVMNASLVCCEAKKWAFYGVYVRHKAHCDALVLGKCYEAAPSAYDYVVQKLDSCLKSDLFPSHAPNSVTDADWAIYVLFLEMWLSVAWLALRNKDLARMGLALDQPVMRNSSAVMEQMLSTQCRSALYHIYVLAPLYVPTRAPRGGMTLGELDHSLVDLKSTYPDDAWAKHDADVIENALRSATLSCLEAEGVKFEEYDTHSPQVDDAVDAALRSPAIHALSIEMCSAQTFEPRVYDSTHGGSIPKKPDSIVGWQDRAQLAALSAEDKAAINRLQKAQGFEVTSFS